MKKRVKAWAFVENEKIQKCSWQVSTLCIHAKKISDRVSTPVTITYEVKRRKKR